MKVFTLGPKGSFSELASEKFLSQNPLNAELKFCNSISEVFEMVLEKSEKDIGVIPLENMIDGSVGESLDLLFKYSSRIKIIAELIIPVNLCLASNNKEISKVISHPKALGQCRNYILEKGFQPISELSTSRAMERISQEKDSKFAAIGTLNAANYYGLKVIEKNIEDNKNNVTRFFVISNSSMEYNFLKKTRKKLKTSLAIHPKKDEPGLLLNILKSFSNRNINLTKIESRPTKMNLGEYLFYIDLEGHQNDNAVKEAIVEIKHFGDVRVFGSYEKVC